jgi:hypothetical protein
MIKILLLLTALLTGVFVQSQNSAATQAILESVKNSDAKRLAEQKEKLTKDSIFNHSNTDYNYLTSLNKIASESEAMTIAENFASLQTKKLRLLKAKDLPKNSYYVVRFVPEEMTNDQYDSLDVTDQDKFLTIRFYYWNEGENKDLEIKGVKAYKLTQINGSYLQLFTFWKNYCKQNADLVETQKQHNMLRDISKNLAFSFYDVSDSSWIIINKS